jgi:predicted O-methyltransferase YrrM
LIYLYPSAVLYWLWNFTFGLLTKQSRSRVALLGSDAPWLRSPLPTQNPSEIIGAPPQLTLYEVETRSGNTSLVEQIVLARLVETRQPKVLFELGTFDGRSALNLIAHAPADAHLYTLDLPAAEMENTRFSVVAKEKDFIKKAEIGMRFQGTEYMPRITRLYGDSAAFDFSPYYGTVDLVFVDASHAYEYARCDTLNALKLLRPQGGLIAWHDYSTDWPGVIRALNEFYRSDARFRNLKKIEGTTLVVLDVVSAS